MHSIDRQLQTLLSQRDQSVVCVHMFIQLPELGHKADFQEQFKRH